jgi:hypothetical protein
MIRTKEHTILLVSDDVELCAAARREFEDKEQGLRVAEVRTVDAARRIARMLRPQSFFSKKPTLFRTPKAAWGKCRV